MKFHEQAKQTLAIGQPAHDRMHAGSPRVDTAVSSTVRLQPSRF